MARHAGSHTGSANQAARLLKPAPEKTLPGLPATGGKAFVLQLGAFRTQEAADAGWKLLAARHAGRAWFAGTVM